MLSAHLCNLLSFSRCSHPQSQMSLNALESPQTRVPEWPGCVCVFTFAKGWEVPNLTRKSILPANGQGKAEWFSC